MEEKYEVKESKNSAAFQRGEESSGGSVVMLTSRVCGKRCQRVRDSSGIWLENILLANYQNPDSIRVKEMVLRVKKLSQRAI